MPNKNKIQQILKEVGGLKNPSFARDAYKGRAIELQTRLAEAHHKMKILASEVVKRNFNLKVLSEAYKDLKNNSDMFNYNTAIVFIKKAVALKKVTKKDMAHYHERRINGLLSNVSEVILDWSITNEIDFTH